MSSSLYHTLNISCQDMLNRLVDMDVTSNNLSNVNTAGYKTNRTNFQELLNEKTKEGITVAGTQILTQQGALKSTNNPLDWAIQGEGFFIIDLPDGTQGYTREGQFGLDAERNLVTASGYRLNWEGEIPEDMVNIAMQPDGRVEVITATGERVEAGTVSLARFANPTALRSIGNNIYLPTEASGEPQTGTAGTENLGFVSSNAVEQSNVDLSREMTRLMLIQRAFQMTVRTFQQTDTMIAQAINIRKV